MLEAADHDRKSFVTLTYNEQHLPAGDALHPADLQRFLKRLRKSVYPDKLRYFAVGEYGEQTNRPHYHLALFGYPQCSKGVTSSNSRGYCCPVCERVQSAWSIRDTPLGHIHSGELNQQTAAYIGGYVTKKLTKAGDPRLDGRPPEFARMSLRPGIGAGAADEVASVLLTHRLDEAEYIPTRLAHGQSKLPLGRYIRNRIRERVDVSKEDLQKFLRENENPEVRALREVAFENAPVGSKAFAFKQALIDHAQGAIIRAESKARNTRKRNI